MPQFTDVPIRVAAIDNHPVVLKGVGAALEETAPDIQLVLVAESAAEVLETVDPVPDVVLLDLGMDRPHGREAEDDIVDLVAAGAIVVIFTSEGRPVPIRRAVEAGAAGLLLKVDPIETIASSIRDAVRGELACSGALAHALVTDDSASTRLSPRQVQILRHISEGLPYRAVARTMGISESTVREHLNRAVASYRDRGLETGNSHGLLRAARGEGHLD